MLIKFYLQPNSITPAPNVQSAIVSTNVTLIEDDIIKECLKRGTALTELAIRTGVLHKQLQII